MLKAMTFEEYKPDIPDISDTASGNSAASDLWIYIPSNDPLESVRTALEGQKKKNYTIKLDIVNVELADGETVRMRELYRGSDLAGENGWTDEYLDECFVAVRAEYDVEYDGSKTFLTSGSIRQNFYLTKDVETGLWEIFDNSNL